MKKTVGFILCLLLTVLFCYALADVAIDENNFPDNIFRAYVEENFDENSDGCLSEDEITAVTRIDFYDNGIASLKGIEYFPALKELLCCRNQLTELDVSRNTKLINLECFENQLSTLDVSAGLIFIDCRQNQLSTLDVSNNTVLETLWCSDNKLTKLDVRNNTALVCLACDGNQLTSLDVSRNTKLTGLMCHANQLIQIDISNCPVLCEYVQNNNRRTNPYQICDCWTWDFIEDKDLHVDTTTVVVAGDIISKPVPTPGPDPDPDPDTCTITFNANGGSGSMAAVTVDKDSEYTLPACVFTAPEGKEFDKWDNGAPGDKIIISSDTEIKALWKDKAAPVPETCTITFNANGGTGSMAAVTVNKGSEYELPVCAFTAPANKEFDKWDKGTPGDKIKVTADTELTAQWKDKSAPVPEPDPVPVSETCTVTFSANGGTGNMDTVIVTKGSEYELPACSFTAPENKEFDKWDQGAPGEKITISDDTEIKALWKDKPAPEPDPEPVTETCTIIFNANGGSGTMDAVTVNKGDTYTLPDCGFTPPEGKEFDGWNLGAAGVQVEITADTELTAQWKDKPAATTCKVTFKANGGKGKMNVQKAKKGQKIKLTANKFTKDGYEFVSWNTKKDGKGTAYKDKASITLKKNITLYAQWGKITLSIKKITGMSRTKDFTVTATLKIGGKTIKGKKVNFSFKGKTTHKFSAKTNSKGIAKIKISKKFIQELSVGKTATIKASYGGVTVSMKAKITK